MKEDFRKLGLVVSPDGVEVMRQREDTVMVGTDQQAFFPLTEPLFAWQPSALWAATMTARVISNLVKVPVWTTVDMSTHRSRSAVHDLNCRTAHVN